MSEREFEEGDVVAMRIGASPWMTVERIGKDPSMVSVVWFDANHVLHRDRLHKDALVLIRANKPQC